MPINRTTYSGAFLKSVRPFAVKVTEGLIRDIVVAGRQYAARRMYIIQMSIDWTANF